MKFTVLSTLQNKKKIYKAGDVVDMIQGKATDILVTQGIIIPIPESLKKVKAANTGSPDEKPNIENMEN